MAGKKFDFATKFVWEVDFLGGWVLENSALFTNMALESLINVFGRDKDQVFDVLVYVFRVPPRLVIKLKKNFVGRITSYWYTQKKKVIKTKAEREKFFDSESSL